MLMSVSGMNGDVAIAPERGEQRPQGTTPLAFLQQMRERHGDVFKVRLMGGRPLLVVGDPELVKQVFNAPADVLCAGESSRRVLDWLLGENSLILLDGARHLEHRRLLLPPLHGARLAGQAGTMRALAESHLAEWPGEEVAALPRLRELALDVVIGVALGEHAERRRLALRESFLALRPPLPNAQGAELSEIERAIRRAEAQIDESMRGRREDPRLSEHDDVLSILLEARHEDGSPLSETEIRDELMTLFVAGTETTAGSLAWALERLSRAPAALRRLEEDPAGPYLDAVIQETLRTRPPVPIVSRLVKRDFRLGERTVPAGETIALSALLVHHRADVYPDPMAFRPERFLGDPPETYTWIPFGGGVRRCIGSGFAQQEMKIVLSALLSRLSLRPTDLKPEGMRLQGNTMVPAGGARVVLEPRGPPPR